MSLTPNGTHPALCVDEIPITPELLRRSCREPDYAAEDRALTALVEEMASRPEGVFQKLAELAMKLCRVESAGMGVLEPGGENEMFRWQTATGILATYLHGTIPCEASLCKAAMAHNQVLLCQEAKRFFPALRGVEPRIYENLLAPWTVNGKPAGMLWVFHHTPEGRFDAEDARLLASFARFASAAYQIVTALQTARAGQQGQKERTRELRQSGYKYRTLFESIHARARTETSLRENESRFRALVTGAELEQQVNERIRELQEEVLRLRKSEEQFRLLVENVQEYALFQTDLEGQVTSWNPGAERLFGYSGPDMLDQSASRLLTPEDQQNEVLMHELAMITSGQRQEDARWLVRKDDSRFWAQWITEPVHDAVGRLRGVVKVLHDETERKRAEEQQLLLMGELNHRVKNTLATVQSIASQTLHGTPDPAQFAEKFQVRLQALARAHNLLTQRSWEGAEVSEIVRDQVILDGEAERITLEGPPAYLTPQTAVALSLVLHELGTNARKYGALSVAVGRLCVHWHMRRAEPVLEIEWTESGGPPVRSPERRGFGTILIEKSLRGVGGTAQLRFAPTGLVCQIQVLLAPVREEMSRRAEAE